MKIIKKKNNKTIFPYLDLKVVKTIVSSLFFSPQVKKKIKKKHFIIAAGGKIIFKVRCKYHHAFKMWVC